ncbi:MAG: Hpt domain-containing protein, partial [Thermoguttaceae bacterium]
MESRQAVKETLEGFSAELLASDPNDKPTIKQLQSDMRQARQAMGESVTQEDSSRLCQSLDLTLEALEALLDDNLPDASAAMEVITNAVAASAEQVDQEDEDTETAWLQESIEDLRNILQSVGGRDSQEEGDQEPSTPVSAGEAVSEPSPVEPETPSAGESDTTWTLPKDIDAELLGEFSTECLDRIAQGEASLLELEGNPDDIERINEIFRAFHTIKGTSGFLELDAIQKLSHLAENLLDRAREGEIKIVGGYADLSLKSCDMLREMIGDLSRVESGGALPKPERFDQLVDHLSDPEAAGFSGEAANAAAVLEQMSVVDTDCAGGDVEDDVEDDAEDDVEEEQLAKK